MGQRVPFVNYGLQYKNLKEEIDNAINRVLEAGDLILRKDVDDFENNLADFVGVKYAVALNSGTDALIFSLLAAGIGKGDEVITVSHTFVASISAIVQIGAKPVLVDVKDDYLMDADKLEKAITPKTKAIIPVYLNGRMPDMDKIMKIAQKHNLIIIEDAAQALGAKYNFSRWLCHRGSTTALPSGQFFPMALPSRIHDGFAVGTINFQKKTGKNVEWRNAGSIGLTGCFSFYPAKILGCFGDGGAITTNSQEIADKIRLLRDHGQKTKTEILCYGYNSRLDNLQAAALNVKLKYLPKWIERRREIAEIYNNGLKDIKEVKFPSIFEKDNHFNVYQNYVIRVQNRDKLFNFLKEKGVETLIKDPIPNHCQIGLGLSHFNLPITEQISKEVISLPMYPELSDEQIEYVIKCLKDFYIHA